MAEQQIPVVLHGVTGRMGQVALRALKTLVAEGGVQAD